VSGNPHLSPEINAALASVKDMTGLFLRDLPVGYEAEVRTKNTTYVLSRAGLVVGGKYGGWRVNGSTFGGSMIRVGWVGEGMYLELQQRMRRVATTAIRDVNVVEVPCVDSS
jgi:hypothetical protein